MLGEEFGSSRSLKDSSRGAPVLESSGDKNLSRDRDEGHLRTALTKQESGFILPDLRL